MPPTIDELLARIDALQSELEEEYRKTREEWAQKKEDLAGEFHRQQRRSKVGLFRFLIRSRVPVPGGRNEVAESLHRPSTTARREAAAEPCA